MSSSFYMILDMLVAMADLGYGGPWLWRPLAMAGRFPRSLDTASYISGISTQH